MNFDAPATLRCWAVDLDIGGVTYTIPALPAADWLMVVGYGTTADIVPGMLTDPDALDDRLVDGLLGEECVTAARAAITAVAGCPWWTATYLVRAVGGTWVGAEFTLRGVDPAQVSFGAYLAAAYRMATRDLDDTKRMQLDMELETAPAGVAPDEWFDEDAAAAGFEAAMAATQDY